MRNVECRITNYQLSMINHSINILRNSEFLVGATLREDSLRVRYSTFVFLRTENIEFRIKNNEHRSLTVMKGE
jgi:hypothetical protein